MPQAEIATCEPAYTVIKTFASPEQTGDEAVAEICGLSKNAVWRWRAPITHGGQGGVIPAIHHHRLLDAAKHRERHLTAEDLVWRPAKGANRVASKKRATVRA